MLAHIDILKMTVTVSISNESTYLLQHMVWVIYKRVNRRIEKHLLCDLSYTSGPLRDQNMESNEDLYKGTNERPDLEPKKQLYKWTNVGAKFLNPQVKKNEFLVT